MQRVARPRSKLFRRAYSRSRSKPAKKAKTNFFRPVVSVPNQVSVRSGLGTKRAVKLVYCEDATNIGGTAVGAIGVYTFRLNSFYDPNLSGLGHQPLGYDQISVLYEKYIVMSCRFKIVLNNTSDSQDAVVGYQVSDQSGSGSVFTSCVEQGQSSWTVLSRKGSGAAHCQFIGYADIPSIMGKTYAQYLGDNEFQPQIGSNPNDTAFLHVFCKDAVSGTAPTTYMYVELEMDGFFLGTSQTPAS